MSENPRKNALDAALKNIEKQFGKGSVMKMGDSVKTDVPVSSSGSISVDMALGIGGYPRGRVVEIYGPESSGKTTLTLHAIAQIQKDGGTAAFIDAEHALDPGYAAKLGVNLDDLIVSQPDNGEQALEIAEQLIRSNAVDMVVVDSVAALVPKAEIEGDMGDSHMGLQARLMSQAMRKLTGALNKSNCIGLFINQVREKIGIVFGNPETTPGGRALKFAASIRIEIRRSSQIKQGTDVMGNETKIKVVKNKMAPPFREALVDIMYGEGISYEGDLISIAISDDFEIIKKSGAWFSYKGEHIGQGKEKTKKYLRDNPEVAEEIAKAIRDKHKAKITGQPVPVPEANKEAKEEKIEE